MEISDLFMQLLQVYSSYFASGNFCSLKEFREGYFTLVSLQSDAQLPFISPRRSHWQDISFLEHWHLSGNTRWLHQSLLPCRLELRKNLTLSLLCFSILITSSFMLFFTFSLFFVLSLSREQTPKGHERFSCPVSGQKFCWGGFSWGFLCILTHRESLGGWGACWRGVHRMLHIQTGGFSTTSAQTKHAQFSIMEHRKTSKV